MAKRAAASQIKRFIIVVGLLGVAAFAVQGGEYGTTDLMAQGKRRTALDRGIDSLERVVDSLTKRKRAIAIDPAVQERIAREEFGMVRGGKELLYRFADGPAGADSVSMADSAASKAAGRKPPP